MRCKKKYQKSYFRIIDMAIIYKIRHTDFNIQVSLPEVEITLWYSIPSTLFDGNCGEGSDIFVDFRISCRPCIVIATVEYTEIVRQVCKSGTMYGSKIEAS